MPKFIYVILMKNQHILFNRDGLEEQLLAEVVKAERPDLEETKVGIFMLNFILNPPSAIIFNL